MKTKQSLMTGTVWLLAVMMSATVCLKAFGETDVAEGGITVTLPGGVKLKMVKIKAGSFMMGSPEDEEGRKPDETQHHVTLTKDFWLGQYEVTQAQYKAITGENPSILKRGGDYSVENVSWDDAMAFCKKLTEQERSAGRLPKGYEYTLPTEAQWEYACRAGSTTALNNGANLTEEKNSSDMDEIGWYRGNSEVGPYPVGQKKPNRWGLYDMHGNVWEWCRDRFGYYSKDPATDPTGPATGPKHVLRSGSWFVNVRLCRSANRDCSKPDRRIFNCGFRVALAAIDSTTASSSALTIWDGKDKVVDLGNGVKMTLKPIPKGSFIMGSPEDEEGRGSDETQHRVTLTKDFWIGQYEVTQAQYKAIIGTNPSYYKNGDNYPVEGVSWNEALTFCMKLTEREGAAGRLPSGYVYTLPTEAQWEYACRAGTTTPFNFGSTLNGDKANCDGNKPYGMGKGRYLEETTPVGSYPPNAWGLYDMHGNVWEWCSDGYDAYPKESVTDPTGPSFGFSVVIRGGAWLYGAQYCRSADRGEDGPNSGFVGVSGFRVALAPIQ